MSGHKHSRKRGSSLIVFEEHELKSGVILVGRRRGEMLPREVEPTMQTAGVLLIAVERGAALPTWVGRCPDRVSDVFVLVSNSDEPAEALQKRLEQRLHLLSESDYQRGLAVLVVGNGFASTAAELSRRNIADRLLSYLAEIGQGMLLLLADENASLDTRSQLLSMAGALAQEVRGTRISISLRFGAQGECEPPQEILALSEPIARRTSRRPPPQSGEMLRTEAVAPLHKATSVAPKRRLRSAG